MVPVVAPTNGSALLRGKGLNLRHSTSSSRRKWRLRAGDWVEVRSAEEIFQTLDENGRLDALPFMPEMLQFCGSRFRVYKSAHKGCDTIRSGRSRRMSNAVHLDGLRCDGSAHGGCQARCLIYWKQAWLKPVRDQAPAADAMLQSPTGTGQSARCDATALDRAAIVPAQAGDNAPRYACQATSHVEATEWIRLRDLRHYVMDLVSRNVSPTDFVKYAAIALRNIVVRFVKRDPNYPYVPGLVRGKTPTGTLNLQVGETVEVLSRDEIMRTIDARRKNGGLYFDVEMEPYCGHQYKVLARVNKIIDERTGSMINISRDCLILENVICKGCLSRNRLFCPRSIYPYWREIWLKRVI
jgi:hypothetical protein